MLISSPRRPPEIKGPNLKLASPIDILHDHPYCGKALRKQVPAKALRGWDADRLPLTQQHTVFKRNGFVKGYDRRAVVEIDGVVNDLQCGWPYFHKKERSAKYLARQKLRDSFSEELAIRPKKKRVISQVAKQSLKKTKPPKGAVQNPRLLQSAANPAYSEFVLSKLLPSKAKHCTIDVTHTSTTGLARPFSTRWGESSPSPMHENSSRSSSVSPAIHWMTKPFSISLLKLPLSRQFSPPPSESTATTVDNVCSPT